MANPILVVDDEADLVTTYERLLRRLGYRVLSARTCQGGLALVTAEPLGLVIADLRLPDGDGLEVVRAARALASPPPVLVATGLASRTARQAAMAAGAAAFLAKPFPTETLTRLVHDLLAGGPETARHAADPDTEQGEHAWPPTA
jgi:DNA-binding response OmpR family regulator